MSPEMSIEPITLTAALVAGLVGSSHCMGMCGGISAALGMATAGHRTGRAGAGRAFGYALVYNGGRIASYTIAGAVAGAIGLAFGQALHAPAAAFVLRILTGTILVAIGLQVAFNLRLLRPLESAGMQVWRHIAPLARGMMARRGVLGALGLGALWGWLPCGLVYGMLLAAAATGDPVSGGATMIAFGLGTAPAMIATGAAAGQFQRLRQRTDFRRLAGGVVILLGGWTMAWPLFMAFHRAAMG